MVELTSSQLTLGSVCKSQKIYVDPESEEQIEFGTLKYPYRTMKSAASEILNFYSHSEGEVEVYIKDVSLELDTFYVLNMTSVFILSHPEYLERRKNANLLGTKQALTGVSKKARLHLLVHAEVDPEKFISQGEYEDIELSQLSSEDFGFLVSRTRFQMSNINVYSDESEVFIVASYLQHRELRLGKFWSFFWHMN